MAKSRIPRSITAISGADVFKAAVDVSDTDSKQSPTARRTRKVSGEEEKTPPIARELLSPGGDAVTWGQLSRQWRVIAGVGGFFLFVVLPFSIYLTRIETNLDSVKGDVKELKVKTEGLLIDSGKQTVRLDHLEKQQNSSFAGK